MPIDKGELLDLARELAKKDKEVCQRAAASKAYYYILHYCLEYAGKRLPGLKHGYKSGGMHRTLVEQFISDYSSPNEKKRRLHKGVGYILAYLIKIRVRADYKLDEKFTKTDYLRVVDSIEKIKSKLEQASKL